LKKIVIVGPGGLGGLVAALLARSAESCEVTVITRPGAHAEAMRRNGLRVEGLDPFTVQLNVVDDPNQVEDCDVLILAVKSQDTAAALQQVGHIQVNDFVASLQNGTMKDDLLTAAFGRGKTIGVVAPEEVIGKMAAGFFPKEQAERDDAEEQGVIKSGRSIEDREWSIRDGAGKKRWFLTAKVPLTNPNGKIMGVLVVDRDITGPKQAAESLRESEERFELAVRGTSDAIWDWNIITGQDYWSSRLYELLGYEVGTIEASFATIKSRLHADDTDSALEALRAHLKDRAPYDVEYRLRTKSGEYRWFRSRGQAVWDETNTARRMVGFIQEITERRQLQAALRETQQLLNSTPDPIIIVNDKGNITVVNTQSEKTFGFNRSELLGQPETP